MVRIFDCSSSYLWPIYITDVGTGSETAAGDGLHKPRAEALFNGVDNKWLIPSPQEAAKS